MPAKKKQSEKKDKRYRAKVTVGHTADGKPIVKYASGKTRKELAKAVEELKRIYIDGLPEQRLDITFGQYAVDWYVAYKEPNIGQTSRNHYATIFNRHLFPVLADRQMRSIRAEEASSTAERRACCTVSSALSHTRIWAACCPRAAKASW